VLSQICERAFQDGERMHVIAYVKVRTSLLEVFAALKIGYGIRAVVIPLTTLQLAVMLFRWTAAGLSRLHGQYMQYRHDTSDDPE
jgi:hypothetical protein